MPEEQYDEISLIEVIGILKKYISLISILFILFVLGTGIITYFFIPKKYQSSTTFYVQQKGNTATINALSIQLAVLGGLVPGYPDSARIGPCEEIVLSRKFLGEILNEQGLPAEPEDIEKVSKAVSVENNKTGTTEISVCWTDPWTAFKLTERILEKYKQNVEEQILTFNNTNKSFLEEQYRKNRERLTRAEEALVSYQKAKGILYLPEQTNKIIENMAELEKERLEAEVNLNETRERLKKAKAQLAKENNTNSLSYQTLITAYNTEQVQMAGLEARLATLNKEYAALERVVSELPDSMLQYSRLLREQKEAEQIYLLIATQLEQAKISEEKENKVVIQVIDPPVVPHKKHSPSTVKNMLIAGILALFVGAFWAFFREYIKNYKEEFNTKVSL
jgi:uncharacterized protein involved in exopolysaccharide biosynthesis